jgi:hypothetical protein
MENRTYMHTCNSCGDEKEVYLYPGETGSELEGCVCDRTVSKKKRRIDESTLLRNFSNEKN